MNNILEEFACGNISPDVVYHRRDSHQHKLNIETLSNNEAKLMAALDDELKETLNQLIEAQIESCTIEGIDRFICGYRLGVLMTMEVFNGEGLNFQSRDQSS
ncbi:MAG: hypothetical protein FWE20_06475 [Defluviitaleaceae bacterium]|nr:hypothetical protein [Defluviitaleaceae bacterium]